MMNTTDDAIVKFRSQFTPREDLVHLNNAGQTLMCRPAREMIETWARRLSEEGAHSWPPLVKAMQEARARLGQFFGCSTNELAFFPGTAGAISQVAFGLDLKAGDEIIVWEQEYPSNLYPWAEAARRKGAKLILAKSPADYSTPLTALEKLISPRTRVIASSWVQFRSGAILDLEGLAALARPRGIFTCVDIIQGAGLLPFNFKQSGIDAACGGSHKWMCASHGAGYLCLREEHIEKLEPVMIGAMSFSTADTAPDIHARPRTDIHRFEPGSRPYLEILAFAAAADLIAETGIARIAQEAEWLARNLMHGLRERGYLINSPHGQHHRGAIVSFTPGPDAPIKTVAEIENRLRENHVSFAVRPPGVRFSPHAFNTLTDIERVLKILTA